jgi:hypothetical protein
MKVSDSYHKWVEWRDEGGVYIGKCPDLITAIHGHAPTLLYAELCELVNDVIAYFEQEGRKLPPATIRPMREVA